MSLKLFVLEPEIVFQARVDESGGVTFPLDEVDFDTVTTGTYSVIDLNMLIVFGSTAGADDLGRSRIRKFPTSSKLYIGRSSQGTRDGEVNFVDNSYITVYAFYPVMSKIPFIDDDGTYFMDSDLDFATYGADSPPVANAGPAYASTIDSGTSLITTSFGSANSFVTEPGASIASQTWTVDDGTITVGAAGSAAITATFPAGFRYVNLLVADDNAEQHTCHVPVLAIDPASDPCIQNFEITRHTIRPDGQELSFRIHDDIDASTFIDGTLVMLIDGDADDEDDRTNVLFTGYIQTDDADIGGSDTGLLRDVEINCVDVMGRLKSLPGFSQVIEEKASPAAWGEMTAANMDRFLHFILQWQSTALDLADWTWSGTTTTYPFKILASDGASLYDQVARRAASLVPEYVFTCNRLAQLAVTVDPMLIDSGSRTSSSQATLTSAFYSDIRYTQQRPPRIHWLRSNAILASASTVATAFAIAPGTAPGQGQGAMDDGENLAVNQAGLNAHCGHKYARVNAPQGLFTITLAEGNDYSLNPAAMTWLKVTIDSDTAAQRGLSFSEARFLMRQIDIRYSHRPTGLTKTITIQAERETVGLPATTVTVPAAEAVDDGGWSPTDPDEEHFNSGLVPDGENLAFIDAGGYIWTTSNFQNATPTWSRNISAAGAASIGAGDVLSFVVDPFSPGFLGTGSAINGWVCDKDEIYKLTDIFGTPAYTSVLTFDDRVARTNGEWGSINASFGRYQVATSDNPWIICARTHRTSVDQNGVYVVYSTDGGDNWSSEIAVSAYNDTAVSNSPRRVVGLWLSPRTPGYALLAAYTANGSPTTADLYKTEDWGATWSQVSWPADPDNGLGYSIHVPWHNNSDESLVYYGSFNRSSNHLWGTRRTDGTTDSDIAPVDNSVDYGPLRSNFGIMSLDTNRLRMVMCGEANESNTTDIDQGGTGAVGAAFVSDDGGSNWTKILGPLTGGPNDPWPLGAAFASGDGDEIYLWGNESVWHSTDGGDNVTDKTPSTNAPSQELVGITGNGS